MKLPLFSVVIPTRHRNDLLSMCLDRLKPGVQTLPPNSYEVIVTDDGVDSTAERMIHDRYPWVQWVAGPRRGPATNRNNGATIAQGDWIVFTDDDCLPDVHWLAAYAEAILNYPNYLVFEGKIYVDRPQRSLAEKSPTNGTGGYLWSCNLAIQENLFKSLNGFDERFPYAAMEDVEFRLRLLQLGHKTMFLKQASVCHPWRSLGGWKELSQHQQSTFIYLSIHPEESSRINSIYYLRYTLRAFLKSTLPGLLKFRGKGIGDALLEHFFFIVMSLLLCTKSSYQS